MNLSHGGHLSHGSPVNFSGQFFQVVPYGVDREREEIDFDQVEELAQGPPAKAHRGGRQRLSSHHRLQEVSRDS